MLKKSKKKVQSPSWENCWTVVQDPESIKKLPQRLLKSYINRKTILYLKDTYKGNAVDDDWQISGLPLILKFLTGVITDNRYKYFEENEILLGEQKRCRHGSRGTKYQLTIERCF